MYNKNKMNAITHRQSKDSKVTKIVDQNLIKQLLTVENEREMFVNKYKHYSKIMENVYIKIPLFMKVQS